MPKVHLQVFLAGALVLPLLLAGPAQARNTPIEKPITTTTICSNHDASTTVPPLKSTTTTVPKATTTTHPPSTTTTETPSTTVKSTTTTTSPTEGRGVGARLAQKKAPSHKTKHPATTTTGVGAKNGCNSGKKTGIPTRAILEAIIVLALVVLIIDRIVERRRRRTQPFETKVLLFEPPVEAPAPEIVKVRDLESFHRDDPAWPRKLSRRTHFAVTEPSQSGVKGTREILPLSEGAARVWAEHVDDLFLGALWSEKIVDGGEDAMPLMMYSGKEQRVLGTVLDGLGGSGAAKIHWESERVVSNAWESARLVRATLETVAASDPSLTTFTSAIPHGLEAVIKKTLSKRADEIVGSKAALSSSLTRILPTTVAGFVLDTSASPQLTTFWAGDSRAYILDADVGLQVLTVDDAEDMDAFEALVVDPPLTNVLCADRPFTLNYRKDGVPRQSLVIAASDGCFNYWPTPPNFEFEILSAICGASSWESAVRQLTRSIGGVTNDDTSLVIVAIGFSTFIELQQRFARRHAEIKQLAFDPLAQLRKDSGTREDFETYRSEAWRIYKKGYEGRLGGSVEG